MTATPPSSSAVEAIRPHVRARYGAIAEPAGDGCGPACCTPASPAEPDCCAPSCCGGKPGASYGEKLGYTPTESGVARGLARAD